LDHLRELDSLQRVSALFRNHPDYAAPENIPGESEGIDQFRTDPFFFSNPKQRKKVMKYALIQLFSALELWALFCIIVLDTAVFFNACGSQEQLHTSQEGIDMKTGVCQRNQHLLY
jgi:hypothetical protein